MALTKIDDRGIVYPLDLIDNEKIRLGTGNDLEIYHDGSNSWLTNTTGNLIIKDTTDAIYIQAPSIRFQDDTTNEDIAKFISDGNVELYYDNSRKLYTVSDGAITTGHHQLTNGNLYLNDSYAVRCGNSGDLQIYHDGSNSYLYQNGTGELRANAAAFRVMDRNGGETQLLASENGAVELYYDNSKKLETASWGTQIHGVLATTSHVDIAADNAILKVGASADIQIYADGSNSYISHNGDGNLRIFSGAAESIRCTEAGATHLFHNGTEVCYTHSAGLKYNDDKKIYLGTGNDLQIYHDSSSGQSIIAESGPSVLKIKASDFRISNSANSADYVQANDGGAVKLFYNGSKKFETTSGGIKVTGNLVPEADNTRNLGDGSANFNSIWASTRFRGNDNVKLVLGSSQDLVIRHDGTNNLIESPVGGDLKIMAGTGDNASETCATFNHDGAVELYHNNVKTFNTESWGNTSRGQIFKVLAGEGIDATLQLVCDDGDDNADLWQIFADASHGGLNIQNYASGSYETNIATYGNGSVELYYDGAKKFETYAYGIKTTQNIGIGLHASWGDNGEAIFGDGSDLKIWHSGSHSYIRDAGTGTLRIEGSEVGILNADGSETIAQFVQNGAVSLRYDNVLKLNTESAGVRVTGQLILPNTSGVSLSIKDGASAAWGNSDDLKIYHDGSNSYIHEEGTGNLVIRTSNFYAWGHSGEDLFNAVADGAVNLYYDNSLRFHTMTDGVRILPAGVTTSINFNTSASGDVFLFKANKDGSDTTSLAFNVQATGGSSVERARVTQNGLTFNGDTSSANALSDYEQGSWTPTMSGATIATQQCAKYTKIGNVVYIQCYVTTAAGSGSSAVTMGGLPFTVSSDSNYSAFASGRIGTGNYHNATNDIVFHFSGASTVVTPRVADGNINEGMMSSTHVMFSGFYHV
tara:strand:- start:1154 stop:3931 length:2778 start_codon:yes stop_codon:yes gene_type:complete